MQRIDGTTVYSATDLVGYLECEHLTTLERAAVSGMVTRPERDDPELRVLQDRGEEHERRYLAYLREQGREVVDGRHSEEAGAGLTRLEQIQRDADLTLQWMHGGADVIYQATLFDGTWLGYADFLLRVEGVSDLGDYHYEVADTKLARRVKGGALLQMCVYSDLLARLQGRMPERMHVALGGSGHRVESHRLDDFSAYYRSVKHRFEKAVADDAELAYPLAVTPPPVDHCKVCRWQLHCERLRTEADDLSLVAGMRSDQARRLSNAGIGTFTALATLGPPLPEIPKLSEASLAAVHQQADLQHRSRWIVPPLYEFLPLQPNLGLAALPPPSTHDLFFDIEGDPFAEEDGLEYLLGVWDPSVRTDAGEPTFLTWWAHSREEEKAAFEGFIDFVMDRWRRHPTMHVYHYAAYERGRMGMLSTRHATREAEVDAMLRGELFVDLYKAVRQGLRIGTPSYSIKKLEPLYALERSVPLQDAGSSVVAYEAYIRSVTAGAPNQAILDQIGEYNRDDCRSNAELRDWLEARREERAEQLGQRVPRPGPSEEPPRALTDRERRLQVLAERLLAGVPADPEQRAADPELQAHWLLANLLEWHHREEKVEWWTFFDRCGRSDPELVLDDESIGQLSWIMEVDRPDRSVVDRYRFDPEQPYRLKVGDQPVDPKTQSTAGKIVALDALGGTLDLRSGVMADRPHPSSLIPEGPIPAKDQKAALERLGDWVAEHGLHGEGPFRAARDFLLGLSPRAGQALGASLALPDEVAVDAARRLALLLDESVLPIQGPPGSGKTWAGAEMVLELVHAGRKVGIVAFTHRAIINLLDEVLDHALRGGMPLSAIRKVEHDEEPIEGCVYRCTSSAKEVVDALARDQVQIAAGTAWLWARADLQGSVDTLFVDEAGQMSLANVVAVSGAARNLVLLGDPQQLSQVKKGAHPEGADRSSLEHVLGDEPVIDSRRGLFLSRTWRLHPRVNEFTSSAFYKGELESAESAGRQGLNAPGEISGTGVRWVGVEHSGNHNDSPEEANVIAAVYRDLLQGSWTNEHGETARLTPSEILVIAPYNAQVELLSKTLLPLALAAPSGVGVPMVATVDKIQGQQGAVAIYSMATSSQDEMPRTIEFLYSLNRLNVATSRGRCLAVVVASPDLLKVRVHTPDQMRLANALCRFVEVADRQAGAWIADEVAVIGGS
ncbi:MAG: TM0106 family RecB-like putative nuclease [Chloroflexota bacterium]|nr:TM0106 family RecB-like putative nuclease [Chloroflexota bacterium]